MGAQAQSTSRWTVSLSRERALRLAVLAPWVVAAAWALRAAVALPRQIVGDSWYMLDAGRLIARSRDVPHRELWTQLGARSWVDQQWLAHLGAYALYAVGGLPLVEAGFALLIACTLALLVLACRDLGASPLLSALLFAFVLPTVGLLPPGSAVMVRAQTAAYPLFAAVLWLVLREVRAPSWRLALALPLLVLWANVHGSVLIGVGLVVLASGWIAVAALRAGARRAGAAAAGVGALALLAPFATPYGAGMLAFYRSTIGNAAFPRVLTEWRPTLEDPVAIVAVALCAIAVAIAVAARGGRPFERLLLVALAGFSLLAVRDLVWFQLGLIVLGAELLPRPEPRLGARLGLYAVAVMAFGLVVAIGQPAGAAGAGDPEAAPAVPIVREAIARDPSLAVWSSRVLAGSLLYRLPGLAGRLAFDARLETLPPATLLRIARLQLGQPAAGDEALLGHYGLYVLLLPDDGGLARILERRGAQRLLQRGDLLVLEAVPEARAGKA